MSARVWMAAVALALAMLLAACSRASPGTASSTARSSPALEVVAARAERDAAPQVLPTAAPPDGGSTHDDGVDETAAVDVLFPEPSAAHPACADGPRAARVRCLVAARYDGDRSARETALDLFDRTGDVAGLEAAHTMDGGYRGMLHLVPALPVGPYRVHLERVAAALLDYETFLGALAPLVPGEGRVKVRYRVHPLALRFFRSVKARTPSAYAVDWTVAYNVDGSLNGSADAVRETLFHEIFHLNDAAHGTEGRGWSEAALGASYAAIVRRCDATTACLGPFAPNSTLVRGGTYYAFQPGNDVREYAAELAIRYYREQRGMLGQGPRITARFKCGRPENASAWAALVDEFFGGIDLVPACSGGG